MKVSTVVASAPQRGADYFQLADLVTAQCSGLSITNVSGMHSCSWWPVGPQSPWHNVKPLDAAGSAKSRVAESRL